MGKTGYRKGNWVMIPPYPGPAFAEDVQIELGNSDIYQLFDLKNDIGQKNNLADSLPDKLTEMITEYEQLKK
jgi:hypothetical protein